MSARQLLTRRYFSTAPHAAAIRRKAVEISGAPSSIARIPDHGVPETEHAVFIRSVGCTRRVFLKETHLNASEMEGLAYRIRTLTKNEGLNSIIISADEDNPHSLPTSMIDRDYPYLRNESVDDGFPPEPGHVYRVLDGFNPLDVYTSGQHVQSQDLLTSLSDLAMALRGDARSTKIPTISIPHGHFTDGGFVVALCSHVLATPQSKFTITNPSKGLGLDPVGLSYILPRLGREFQQPAADYAGCGLLLALTGYTANAADLMETGLATQYLESTHALGLLETTLAELRPWNQQALVKNPIRFHGQPEPTNDHNAEFRNVSVAEAIHNFTSYRADGADMWTFSDQDAYAVDDPSIEDWEDGIPWHEMRSSNLVNYAATFDDIFRSESTVLGVLERFREVAARETTDPEEQEGILVAKDICQRMEAQSPLALCAVYRLLQEGSKNLETLHSCMARERRVQAALLAGDDFCTWAQYRTDTDDAASFGGWKHDSVSEVTDDEVTELLGQEIQPEQVLRGAPPPRANQAGGRPSGKK